MGDIYASLDKTNQIIICPDGQTVSDIKVGRYKISVEKHSKITAVVRVGEDGIGFEEKQIFPGKSKRMYGDSVVIRHERE